MFCKFFIDRPRFAIVVSLFIIIAGAVSLLKLPTALYPEVTPPEITVEAIYPGASAEVLAKTVGIPLEDAVNGVENMLYMSSSSNDSQYTLTISFKVGTDPDMALVKVQSRVQNATSQLPQEVSRQGISVKRRSSNTLAYIAFMSPDNTLSPMQISDYIFNNVQRKMIMVDGIGSAEVHSAKLSMRIWLDTDKMAALNIPVSMVSSAIANQNYQPSLGKVGTEPVEKDVPMVYALQTLGRINDVESFENIIVRTAEQGGIIHLKDIAKVEIGQEDYSVDSLYNGKNAVLMALSLTSGANALQTMDNAKKALAEMEPFFPKGLKYEINYDSTKYIDASIEEVIFTLVLTFFLVVFVCYVFLQDWKSTLVPSATIPVSLAGTFAVIAAFGYSMNMFTLFGLLLAIGLVVDDAIVVIERVMYLMQTQKLSPKQAAIQTMQEVSGALFATSLILMFIFIPIAFMDGIVGEIYRQFAVTIVTAIFFSLINALTLSPVLCSLLLTPTQPKTTGILGRFNRFIDNSIKKYTGIAGILARHVGVIVVIFICFIVGLLGLFKLTPTSFIPDEDQGVVVINIQLPEGASRSRTRAIVDQISPLIMEEKAAQSFLNIMGYSFVGGKGENISMAFVVLKPWGERQATDYSTRILERLQAKLSQIPGADFQLFEMPAIPGLGNVGGLDIRLQSLNDMDYTHLDAVAQSYVAKLNQNPAFAYAFSTFTSKTPNVFLDIDRTKAERMNVPMNQIFTTLENYLGSGYINDINLSTQINKVMIQSAGRYRSGIDNINDIFVPNTSGKRIPLKSLITMHSVLMPRVITRYNQYANANITAIPRLGVSSGQAMQAANEVAKTLPKGYTIDYSTMSYQEKTSQGQIGGLIALAMIFAYLFLVAQYESFVVPIPVLLSLVVAMMGAMIGLLISGLPLSIYAQLGLILLVGLASKNAILIVEFAKTEQDKGKSIITSALIGLKERFRAVLMTAFAFVLGVLPMVIATGAACNSRRAIGVPVFYGMLAGTVVGLIMIPLFYVLVQSLHDKQAHQKKS